MCQEGWSVSSDVPWRGTSDEMVQGARTNTRLRNTTKVNEIPCQHHAEDNNNAQESVKHSSNKIMFIIQRKEERFSLFNCLSWFVLLVFPELYAPIANFLCFLSVFGCKLSCHNTMPISQYIDRPRSVPPSIARCQVNQFAQAVIGSDCCCTWSAPVSATAPWLHQVQHTHSALMS